MSIVIIKNDNIEIPIASYWLTNADIYLDKNVIEYEFPESLYFLLTNAEYDSSKPLNFYEFVRTARKFDNSRLYLHILSYFFIYSLDKITDKDIFLCINYLYNCKYYPSLFLVLSKILDSHTIIFFNCRNILEKINIIKELISVDSYYMSCYVQEYKFINSSDSYLYYKKNNNYYMLSSKKYDIVEIKLPGLELKNLLFESINDGEFYCYYIENKIIYITFFILDNDNTIITREISYKMKNNSVILKNSVVELIKNDNNVYECSFYTFDKKLLKKYYLIEDEVTLPMSRAGNFVKIHNSYFSEKEKRIESTNLELIIDANNCSILRSKCKKIFYLSTDKCNIRIQTDIINDVNFSGNKLRILNILLTSLW